MENLVYSVESAKNVVRIWTSQEARDNGEAPMIYQPHDINGSRWASYADATAWAEEVILSMQNPVEDVVLEETTP